MKKVSVKTLFVLVILYSLAANFAHPITPTFIVNLGLHNYMFGVAFACMALTNFLFSPFFGKMCDKYGDGLIFSLCHLGYGVMQIVFGLSKTEWQIALARLIGGFFISGISVSQLLYVLKNSDNVSKDMAVVATLNMVVSPFGFLIGGFLGDISIFYTFIIQGVSLFLIGVIGLFVLGDGKLYKDSKFTKADLNPFKDFVSCKDIVNTFIIAFLICAGIASFGSTCYEQCFNYYIKDIFGFPSSYNGILKAGVGIIALIVNFTITMLLLKKNIFKSCIGVFSLLFVMLVGVCIIEDMLPFIIINVVFFGMNSIYLPLQQALLDKFKTKDDGKLVGLFNAIRSLGMVFGSLIAGFVYELDPKLSFVLSALAFLICIFLSMYNYKCQRREYEGFVN